MMIVCTHLEMCLEESAAIKPGASLAARLKENNEAPCLYISCAESHSGFTCSFLGQERLLFLVEDVLTENQRFLAYIEKKLVPDQLLLSLEAVQSAVKKFYEHQGDIQQCIE